MSIVKRNPGRNKPPHSDFTGYQPEHERLNREPVVMKPNPNDFIIYNQRQVKNKTPFVHTGQNADQLMDQEPNWNEEILDEEVSLPPQTPYVEEIEDDLFEESESFFSNIPTGEYILVSNDQALLVGSKEEVEAAILDIISSDDEVFRTLSVFKKMSVKVGALVSDD